MGWMIFISIIAVLSIFINFLLYVACQQIFSLFSSDLMLNTTSMNQQLVQVISNLQNEAHYDSNIDPHVLYNDFVVRMRVAIYKMYIDNDLLDWVSVYEKLMNNITEISKDSDLLEDLLEKLSNESLGD